MHYDNIYVLWLDKTMYHFHVAGVTAWFHTSNSQITGQHFCLFTDTGTVQKNQSTGNNLLFKFCIVVL